MSENQAAPVAIGAGTLSSYQDSHPDLSIDPCDIYVRLYGTNVSNGLYGKMYEVHVKARNIGESSADYVSLSIGIRNAGQSWNLSFFSNFYGSLDSNITNNSIEAVVNWTLNTTISGACEIWAWIDTMNVVDESNETNNFATADFAVLPLYTDVVVMTDREEYHPGQMAIIAARVTYAGTDDPVSDAQISFFLVDMNGDIVFNSETPSVTTAYEGYVTAVLTIPADLETGIYQVGAKVFDEPHLGTASIEISKADSGIDFTGILTLAIVVIVAAAAAIGLAYWLIVAARMK